MKKMKNALVILAGGIGSRFNDKIPKQFKKYNNYNLIEYFLKNTNNNYFDVIVIACNKIYRKLYLNNVQHLVNDTKIIFSKPGKTRQKSSYEALIILKKYNPNNVLIHDAARPFCSNTLIKRIIINLKKHKSVIPYIINTDRKLISNNEDLNTKIKFIQTPQGFRFKTIYKAHAQAKENLHKDDASLLLNKNIKFIKGEGTNFKITYKNDFKFFKLFEKSIYKYGIGYDIHQFNDKKEKGLKLCATNIDYYKLIGHSDADVGIHAICDSIFGALSLNDIGHYFSNKNQKWKNTNSIYFLKFAKQKLIEHKFFIVNLDINFICERPIISKYRSKMINKISEILAIPNKIISIKATSNEKIGFIGDGKGIAAESIVQISNEKNY